MGYNIREIIERDRRWLRRPHVMESTTCAGQAARDRHVLLGLLAEATERATLAESKWDDLMARGG